ncbi:hypothetical protein BDA96_03G398700 [Sorghum bicolor]|jgi:hypothetical protein|uniref:Uncharacterized protein n=2 Tax=Sorghum bicolor TaxID=4558 RepID=A0A921RJ39_SORBI|nr:hypothetical protein BDA96_03G398700 [Sorghum bicolor]OQU87937.1 hypothetical protein SORBI_3003G369533 [Sorghum bicolor]
MVYNEGLFRICYVIKNIYSTKINLEIISENEKLQRSRQTSLLHPIATYGWPFFISLHLKWDNHAQDRKLGL